MSVTLAQKKTGGWALLERSGLTFRAILLPPLMPVLIGLSGSFLLPKLFEVMRGSAAISSALDSVPGIFIENGWWWFMWGMILPFSYSICLFGLLVFGIPLHLFYVRENLSSPLVYVIAGALAGPTAAYLGAGMALGGGGRFWSPNLVLMLYGGATAWAFWRITSKARAADAG